MKKKFLGFLTVGLLVGPMVANAAPVTVNPGDTLGVDFQFSDSFSATPNALHSLFYPSSGSYNNGGHTATLYNGTNTLGTISPGSAGAVFAVFRSTDNPFSAGQVDFSSIRNQSINGRIEATLSGPSLIYDPELAGTTRVAAYRDIVTGPNSAVSENVGDARIQTITLNGATIWSASTALHQSFSQAYAQTALSPDAQAAGASSFDDAYNAALALNRTSVTGTRAGDFIFDRILFPLLDLHAILNGGVILPFIIMPCSEPYALYANCGTSTQYQVQASLFDLVEFKAGLQFPLFDDLYFSVGDHIFLSNIVNGNPAISLASVLGVSRMGEHSFVEFDVRWISDVTASVPEPGTLALLGLGLVGMGMRRRIKAS